MGRRFWDVVNEVIKESDIILEVIDARFIDQTRNLEIEDKVNMRGKRLIFILNKSDLITIPLATVEHSLKGQEYVFVSAKNNLGTTILRSKIKEEKKRPLIVGILGYPNTGKSSLINVLKQKKSAGTASVAGFTRGLQKIKIDTGIYLLDTPGVIPYKEKDDIKHAMINIKHPSKIEDPEFIAEDILIIAIEKNPKLVETLYKIKLKEGEEIPELLGRIALNFKWLKKGGLPNIDLISRKIIEDWQRGRLII